MYAYALKKKCIVVIIVAFICCSVGCLSHSEKTAQENCTEMDALSTHSISFGDKTIQNISIVTNQPITDYVACAHEIIQHCIDNDFKTIRFSYDMHGYPVEVNAHVYESEKDFENGDYIFQMSYTQDSSTLEYNIVDNPEHFTLKIK